MNISRDNYSFIEMGEQEMTNEFSEAITETLDILEHMDKKYTDCIPEKFKEFLENNKSKIYKPKFDHSKELKDLNLKEKTKNILSILYMKYWCSDEDKENYSKILKENEKNYQKEQRIKYNPDNLFKEKNKKELKTETNIQENKKDIPVIIEKKSFWRKIIDSIKSVFKN